MTTHSSALAWKIPWTEEPGRLQSVGSWRVRHDWTQHTRLPCPSPTLGACLNSCPLSQWCHSTISSSVVPFSYCLQSFPALRSFQMSQFLTSGGQSIGASASASVLPVNIQDWFPLRLTDLISLQPKGLSRVLSNTTVESINSSVFSFLHSQLSHPYMTNGKTIPLTRWTFVGKVMSLHFNMLSRLVIIFLPRSQFFTSEGQSIGASASEPVLPMNIQNWFSLGLSGLISLQSKGLSRVFSNTTVQKN